jgi:hypothetical protein
VQSIATGPTKQDVDYIRYLQNTSRLDKVVVAFIPIRRLAYARTNAELYCAVSAFFDCAGKGFGSVARSADGVLLRLSDH